MSDFNKKPILIYDLETSSLSTETAEIKWFGGYSYLYDEYYTIPFEGNQKEIKSLFDDHKILISFNGKAFDNPILVNNYNNSNMFDYKVLIDLLEISAPKSGKYGKYNKHRLGHMGFKLKNYSLKNIIELLKLDTIGKGDVDYEIFKKDIWTEEEIADIIKYLKQDINLTKKLFEWYHEQFKPLLKFLPKKEQDNMLHIKSSLSVLAYHIICNKAGLPVVFKDKDPNEPNRKSFDGGHHILNRQEIVRGNIVDIDFTSAYPHAIIQGNLCSPIKNENEKYWCGGEYINSKKEMVPYYNIIGKYNSEKQGKIEIALKDIMMERLKAKKEKDIAKSLSYKIIINSFYGILGNPVFKSVYNRDSAADCTHITRTWLKKLSKILEVEDYTILYGFTDSIYVKIPHNRDKEDLMEEVQNFLIESKSHLPFPVDSFDMAIEEEMQMMWFIAKNCYLWVTQPDKNGKVDVKYKSTLFNQNTPAAVKKLFDEYMKPIIIKTLDIPFTRKELEKQLRVYIEEDISLGCVEHKTLSVSEYKNKTSLQFQISDKYGPGRHFLLPNKNGIGVGLSKNTKKKIGVRYCTFDEFKRHNLEVSDIDLNNLLGHLKAFYEKNEIKNENKQKYTQTIL